MLLTRMLAIKFGSSLTLSLRERSDYGAYKGHIILFQTNVGSNTPPHTQDHTEA